MATWYAVINGAGTLISTGTSVADAATLSAQGYSAITLPGDPTGQVWNATTKTFSARPAPPKPTKITALAFIKRFVPAEYAGIAGSTDPQVMMFMLELQHAPAGMIDLTDPDITNGLAYLVSVNLLTQARATTIGTP
jgi:hypothetical protein